MTADERMLRLIESLGYHGLRLLCAALWEGLKRRMCTNESADEWYTAMEGILRRAGVVK
jgi:hypothetical protein